MIDNSTLLELQNGYRFDQHAKSYACLFCRQIYQQGIIYPMEEVLYDAEKAMVVHIQQSHGSVFETLIQLDKKYTGLSDVQREMLQLFHKGLSDKEILERSSSGSISTIRQHRFKLKEKERQAKIFLALMANLESSRVPMKDSPIHKEETIVDSRYGITETEREKVLQTYFKNGLDGAVDIFPSKEKRKIMVLQHILKRFDQGKKYSEKEVNDIIKTAHDDYVTVRRYFIEYGFMDRNSDGSQYWVITE
jgi:DNA-binding CsgD family transcriptional regulator